MGHLHIRANPAVGATEFEGSTRSEDLGERYLAGSQAYLECRSRGGEPAALVEAWRRFYDFYAPRIRSFLRGCGLAEEDVNDCSQEVWQDIVARLAHFRRDASRGRLSTWIITLARNKAVDAIRRRNRHVSEPLEDDAAAAPMDPRPGPDLEFERRQTLAQVQRILLELSGKVSATSFQAFYQRWIEGRPTAEVAAALELTPDQVRFRVHRMKRKFRDMLERSMDREGLAKNPVRNEIDG